MESNLLSSYDASTILVEINLGFFSTRPMFVSTQEYTIIKWPQGLYTNQQQTNNGDIQVKMPTMLVSLLSSLSQEEGPYC